MFYQFLKFLVCKNKCVLLNYVLFFCEILYQYIEKLSLIKNFSLLQKQVFSTGFIINQNV